MHRPASFALLLAGLVLFVGTRMYAQEEQPRRDPLQPTHDKTIIGEAHFHGDAGLAISEQKRFEEMFKGECDCDDGVKELTEQVRYLYLEQGYYKAETHSESRLLSIDDGRRRVSVDVQIEQNLQYRLRNLTLTGQKAFSAEQLKAFFPIQSGEVFNAGKIREGLDNLRKQYGEYGYINMTPVPEAKVDDGLAVIDLSIDIDEGAQFRVATIGFSGIGARDSSFQDHVIKSLKFKPGDVFNGRLLEDFFNENHSWLPPESTAEGDVEIAQNTREHTVDLYFVFK